MIKGYLECISKKIDSNSSKYDIFLLLRDFNSKPSAETMKSPCQIHNLKNSLYKHDAKTSAVTRVSTWKLPKPLHI